MIGLSQPNAAGIRTLYMSLSHPVTSSLLLLLLSQCSESHHSAPGISQLRRLLSSEDSRTACMSIFFHFRTLCTLCCLIEVRQNRVIKDWVNCLEFKAKEKRNTLKQHFSRADQRPEISDITLQFWVLQQFLLLLPPLIYHLLKVLMPPGSKFDGSDKRWQ